MPDDVHSYSPVSPCWCGVDHRGRALIVAEPDAQQLEADFLDDLPGSLGDDPEIETALAHLVIVAQREARAAPEAQLLHLRDAVLTDVRNCGYCQRERLDNSSEEPCTKHRQTRNALRSLDAKATP